MKKYIAGCYCGLWITLLAGVLPAHAGIYTNLHAFVDGSVSDGSGPNDAVLVNGQLFGSASQGGASNNGMVYTIGTNGTGFATVHDFAGSPTDGASPNELLLVGTTVYGTTFVGGTNGNNGGI